tara:strand:- start:2878 stop:3684 length:807 start_codon:yes stop_codon:yes gene_type:complete
MNFKKIFSNSKPIIGMVHLPALPGTPLYSKSTGIENIINTAKKDLIALQNAGVDAVMFGNENDRPYELKVDISTTATMAYVIGVLKETMKIPFGVNVLWDPISTIALATATGASFAREIFSGVYASDMGLWNPDAAKSLRYRKSLDNENLLLFFNISAEFAHSIDRRSLAERAKSIAFSSLPDAILVSGPITGESADVNELASVKKIINTIPVLANTGVNISNVEEILKIADGAIVGSSLKVDGITWNPVDEKRALEFMNKVKEIRNK